jgi:hypothetical protein
MENLSNVHKAQIKRFKAQSDEYRTLAGNLTMLAKAYNNLLTREQRGMIMYVFKQKAFRLFEAIPHKQFKRRWERATIKGYTFALTETCDKTVGFFETAETAKLARAKYVNDPTKDTSFWLTVPMVETKKTYESKFSTVQVLMGLQYLERELSKAFNITGLFEYTKGSQFATIPHTPEQLYRVLNIEPVEETELEEVA